MATLGILLIWSGYTFGVFGFSRIKSAYGNSPVLTLSDLALPTHRAAYLSAATSWTGSSSSSPAAAQNAATAAVAGTPAGAINPLGGSGSTPSGPVAAGATGTARLGRTPTPSPTPVTSGTFVPAT